MEEQSDASAELTHLQNRSDKFSNAIEKVQNVASTVGTTEFQGPQKYRAPSPDHPDYLKELIKTTLTSSEVNKKLHEKTLPALEEMYSNLQAEIEKRQHLLSEAANLQIALSQLAEYESEGYLTNPDVVQLVKNSLQKINEELYPPVQPKEEIITPSLNTEVANPFEEKSSVSEPIKAEQNQSIEPEKLQALQIIAHGGSIEDVLHALNLTATGKPFSEEDAEKYLTSLFAKLYFNIIDGSSHINEVDTWKVIRDATISERNGQKRNEFRDMIYDFFHPEMPKRDQDIPKKQNGNGQRGHKERQIVDPHDLIKQVLQRVVSHGTRVGTNQHFNPIQVYEIFGVTQESARDSLEKGYVSPLKRESRDHHPAYTLTEAIQLAVIKKYKGATREQIEELPLLIELEVEQWMKDHPDAISAK